MKKAKLSFLVLFLFLIAGVQAQLFWKISGNGLQKPSYLFGTHHLIEKERVPDFEKITAFIPQTDAVVGEMDMGNQLKMQLKMMKYMMMKDTTMHQLLTDAEYAMVDAALKDVMGKGLDQLGRMKPAMLSAMYEMLLLRKEANLKKQPEALDIIIQTKGRKARKKIIGLETIEQQCDMLFEKLSLTEQARGMVKMMEDKQKLVRLITELNAAYVNGDLQAISRLSKEEDGMMEHEMQVMLTDRNANWIQQLRVLLPQKSCFIAVGCMHLVDEQGLIQQLRKLGYMVEAVRL